VTTLIICLMVALLFYALYRRRYVRFGFKILGATLFLEASDPQIGPKNSSDVGRISPELHMDSEQR
jgi:hypothetical protein